MGLRPGAEDFLWMVAGAVILAVLLLVGWHLRHSESPAEHLSLKATRVDLVSRMELDLARASEAEKSAVLATTDEDSQTYAKQARSAMEEVEKERLTLEGMEPRGAAARERELLAQFSRSFLDLRRVDEEVLGLAVKNTNVKAYALAFGPAMEDLEKTDAALSRVVQKCSDSADAKQVMLRAFGAQTALLRIQALLAPHIAEESDAKMDALEAQMSRDETLAEKDFEELRAMPRLRGDPDLASAASAFGRYRERKTQVLRLSRENTNVRSLALSLNQKRKAMIVSLDTLGTLKETILREPIPGVSYGKPSPLK